MTHVWSFHGILALDNIPENIDGGIGFNSNTRLHALLVNVADQLLGTGTSGGIFIGGIGRSDRGNSSLVVEAVKVATGLLKFADPFVRLKQSKECQWGARDVSGMRRVQQLTSIIIIWQSKVPRPQGSDGRSTQPRI